MFKVQQTKTAGHARGQTSKLNSLNHTIETHMCSQGMFLESHHRMMDNPKQLETFHMSFNKGMAT